MGSGNAVAISALLEQIISFSSREISVQVDPARLRPVDIPIIQADISKLQKDTDWTPQVPLKQTLADTLAYWRGAVCRSQ